MKPQDEFNKFRSELLAELNKYPKRKWDWADELSAKSYDMEGIDAVTLRQIEQRGYRRGLKKGRNHLRVWFSCRSFC